MQVDGYIRKNLTQNGEHWRYSWGTQKKKKKIMQVRKLTVRRCNFVVGTIDIGLFVLHLLMQFSVSNCSLYRKVACLSLFLASLFSSAVTSFHISYCSCFVCCWFYLGGGGGGGSSPGGCCFSSAQDKTNERIWVALTLGCK